MDEPSLAQPVAFVAAGAVIVGLTLLAHARHRRDHGFLQRWVRLFPSRKAVISVFVAGSAAFVGAWSLDRYGLVQLDRGELAGVLLLLVLAMLAFVAIVLGLRVRRLEDRSRE